jgi:hypothetical protein
MRAQSLDPIPYRPEIEVLVKSCGHAPDWSQIRLVVPDGTTPLIKVRVLAV